MVRVKVTQSYSDLCFIFDDARSAAAFMDVVIGTAESKVKITVEEIEEEETEEEKKGEKNGTEN